MSSKPETTFTNAVHRHLPPLSKLYREKMHNPYRGGTPDYWYSGRKDLWIEWKFLALPKKSIGVKDIDLIGGKNPIISGLQDTWLGDRFDEGRNVWVIVGHKDGGVIMETPSRWRRQWPVSKLRAESLDRAGLAQEIERFTRGF